MLRPFLVADIETVLDQKEQHVPYAAGVMRVDPAKGLPSSGSISYWFSEDFFTLETFHEKSTKMLDSFIGYLTKVTRKEKKIVNIDFHNFSRFDGILLIRHLIDRHPEWKLELLMHNNVLYELVVNFTRRRKKVFRDSCLLFPGSLANLASSLCPPLGGKSAIDHTQVNMGNILARRGE
jgi:hypothetical protein